MPRNHPSLHGTGMCIQTLGARLKLHQERGRLMPCMLIQYWLMICRIIWVSKGMLFT